MTEANLMLLKNEDAGHTNFGMLDKIFEYGQVQIRVELDENNRPWFSAKDIARALNITWSGHTLSKIKDSWKGMVKLTTPTGLQNVTVINLPAVHKLAFRSNKKEADEFTDWVAESVLVPLQEAGMYLSEEKLRQLDGMQKAFDQLRKELEKMKPGKKTSLPKKDYMRNLITACKHVDLESGKALEFAGVQKIRSSMMTAKEKNLWLIQQLSRSGCGQMKKILKVLVDEGCLDADSYQIISGAIHAVEKLRTHFCHDELIRKTIEIRDHDLNERPTVLISALEEKAIARELSPSEVGELPRPMTL